MEFSWHCKSLWKLCIKWLRDDIALPWRHNDCHGIWNHQNLDCLLSRLFKRTSKKTSKLFVTGLCERNPPVAGGFPSQRASNAENALCITVPLWEESVGHQCISSQKKQWCEFFIYFFVILLNYKSFRWIQTIWMQRYSLTPRMQCLLKMRDACHGKTEQNGKTIIVLFTDLRFLTTLAYLKTLLRLANLRWPLLEKVFTRIFLRALWRSRSRFVGVKTMEYIDVSIHWGLS